MGDIQDPYQNPDGKADAEAAPAEINEDVRSAGRSAGGKALDVFINHCHQQACGEGDHPPKEFPGGKGGGGQGHKKAQKGIFQKVGSLAHQVFSHTPREIHRTQGVVDKTGELLAAAAGFRGVFAGVGEDEQNDADGQQEKENLQQCFMFCIIQGENLFPAVTGRGCCLLSGNLLLLYQIPAGEMINIL